MRSARRSGSSGSSAPRSAWLSTTCALIVAAVAGCAPTADTEGTVLENSKPPLAEPAVVGPALKLAAIVGQLARPAEGEERIGFYAADLGWSFRHGDELRILFGDSWRDADGALIGDESDDTEGWISLADFPDGDAVERHALLHASAAAPFLGQGPPVHLRRGPAGDAASIAVFPRGLTQRGLHMSIGQVPIAGWSNGADAFALFHRGAPLECSGGEASACPEGFSCDRGLGVCANPRPGTAAQPCVLGAAACDCVPVAGNGLCQDRTSSQYREGLDAGRLWSVVLQHEVGRAVVPGAYVTQPWSTNKFMNAVAKSVRDFDPVRSDADENDYGPVTAPGANAKVLLWGRPNFVGIGAAGLDAALYFAYADMPRPDAHGAFAWQPRYFAGMADGMPQFSTAARDAVPLELAGSPELTREHRDFVNQMGISYLAPLRRWAMFYGGGAPSTVDGSVTLPDGTRPLHDARNAVVARFAERPWGPWSAPVEVLAAGDPLAPLAPDSEFAAGGLLHHEACKGAGCAPGEPNPFYQHTPWGFFYAPLIVDEWTEARGERAADVYWFLSTWSPYQVVLMKTRIER